VVFAELIDSFDAAIDEATKGQGSGEDKSRESTFIDIFFGILVGGLCLRPP